MDLNYLYCCNEVGKLIRITPLSALVLPIALVVVALPAQAQQQPVTYQCANGKSFQADYQPDRVQVRLDPTQTLTLPQAISASGARYSDGHTTLWDKGGNAFIEVDNQRIYDQCVAQTAAPSARSPGSASAGAAQATMTESTAQPAPDSSRIRALW